MQTHPRLINCSYYCINSNIIAVTKTEQNNFNELNKRISLRNKKSTQILIFIETAAADEYWSYTHTYKFKWKNYMQHTYTYIHIYVVGFETRIPFSNTTKKGYDLLFIYYNKKMLKTLRKLQDISEYFSYCANNNK